MRDTDRNTYSEVTFVNEATNTDNREGFVSTFITDDSGHLTWVM